MEAIIYLFLAIVGGAVGGWLIYKLLGTLFNWMGKTTQHFSGTEQFFWSLAKYCAISATLLAFGVGLHSEGLLFMLGFYLLWIFSYVAIEIPRLLYCKLRGKSYAPRDFFLVRFMMASARSNARYSSSSVNPDSVSGNHRSITNNDMLPGNWDLSNPSHHR